MNEEIGGRHLAAMTQPEAARALARGTASWSRAASSSMADICRWAPTPSPPSVAERVAGASCSVLPLSPVGVAPYHMPWPGSLTLRPDTFLRLLFDVCEGLRRPASPASSSSTGTRATHPRSGSGPMRSSRSCRCGWWSSSRTSSPTASSRRRWSSPTPAPWRRPRCLPTAVTGPPRQMTRGSRVDAGNAGRALFRRPDSPRSFGISGRSPRRAGTGGPTARAMSGRSRSPRPSPTIRRRPGLGVLGVGRLLGAASEPVGQGVRGTAEGRGR